MPVKEAKINEEAYYANRMENNIVKSLRSNL